MKLRGVIPTGRTGRDDRRWQIRSLLKAVMFTALALLSSTAFSDRYLDESFRVPAAGAGPNVGMGLLLLGGVMLLCFLIADIRTYGYIVASVLLLLGFASGPDFLILAVPILLACLAGTLMEKKVESDSYTDSHLDSDRRAANSSVGLGSKKPERREANTRQVTATETQKDVRCVENMPVFREIDRRSNKQSYTGVLDQNDAASKAQKTPSNPNTQPPKPRAHNVRDEPKAPPQALRTSFCSPVTIESPSRAIRGEKLVEDVGLVTSSGDFIAILDKFSWLPHSRTSPIALATPTEEPVTITFARRRSAFGPERTPLGTFLLTGFSGDDAVPNVLEIRVSAEDSELYFDVRDAAGSHLTITRQS